MLAQLKRGLPKPAVSSSRSPPASTSDKAEPQDEGASYPATQLTATQVGQKIIDNTKSVEDIYFADEHLPLPTTHAGRSKGRNGDVLPDSDLLKAIHAYTADFYARTISPSVLSRRPSNAHRQTNSTRKRKRTEVGADEAGKDDEKDEFSSAEPASNVRETGNKAKKDQKMAAWPSTASLDETALLALGILLEESCLQVLGRTGDLVFTEGEPARASHRECHVHDQYPPGHGGQSGESDTNAITLEDEEEGDDDELSE